MRQRSVLSPRSSILLILLGAAGLFLIGNERMPLWDRDEPRYAECSREMLKSGDWVVPRFLGELRAHKPPLVYWCQATAMAIFGQTGAAARLPSALAAFLTAAMLAAFVWRFAGPRRAIWASFVFSTSALTVAAANFCNTDALLLFFIAVGQGCLFGLWRRPQGSWLLVFIFWLSVALAGLTKGPVVLGMHAATLLILAYLNRARFGQSLGWLPRLKPLVGIVILLAVDSPWLILVHQRAPDFLSLLLNRAGKYASSSGAEGHAHWPGFYLLLIWALFFPWSLMLPTAIGMGLRHRKRPLLRFAFAAAVGPWIVMELVPNKLPFYILPSFPGLSILAAEAIVRCSCSKLGTRDDDMKQPIFRAAVGLWTIGVIAICACVWLAVSIGGGSPILAIAWIVAAAIYASIVFVAFLNRRIALAAATMGIGAAVLLSAAVIGVPSMTLLTASRQIGHELTALGAGGSTKVAMIDYREPSLAFYQGGGAREIDIGKLSRPNPPQWSVMTMDAWSKLSPRIQARFEIIGPPRPVLIYNDGAQLKKVVIIRRRM